MKNRIMLKLAAKVVGIHLKESGYFDGEDEHGRFEQHWDPLEDDCDAFSLVVQLGIKLARDDYLGIWTANDCVESFLNGGDPYAAARKAIVRAAAEIGKSVK